MAQSELLNKFMNMRCCEQTIRFMVKQYPEPVKEIARMKGISEEAVLTDAIKVLVEDGVSNEFAYNMLCMWRDGTADNVKFTAREAMLFQHISWTNVEGREYMTNSIVIKLPKEG